MSNSIEHENRATIRDSANSSFPKAVILSNGDLTPVDRRVGELLDFFGIAWSWVNPAQILSGAAAWRGEDWSNCSFLGSAPTIASCMDSDYGKQDALTILRARPQSLFIYGFEPTDSCHRLLRGLTGDPQASIRRQSSSREIASVTAAACELCGPMSGLNVAIEPSDGDLVFNMTARRADFESIMSTRGGQLFFRVRPGGIPIYVSASGDIIDINAPAQHFFDVKTAFSSAVPIAMYLRRTFPCIRNSHKTNACLIVDDPPLKRRYGFLEFGRALELMDEHNFAMSLAFIPWNWRRTNSEVVSLFRNRPDRFSIAVHGCDHTGGEFAARSAADLGARIKVASLRMALLQERTSLKHDRVMVFPRGEFSGEAAWALKRNNFMAAVNTEVTPANGCPNETTIADLWDVAIRKYGNFPIFTRRYPSHGLENFAFDTLLGKPCLVVVHHQGFKDDARDLVELVDKLNSLSCELEWRTLGDTIERSFRIQSGEDGNGTLEMYGVEAVVENTSEKRQAFEVTKKENDPNCVQDVTVNGQPIKCEWEAGKFVFTVGVAPREAVRLRCIYIDSPEKGSYPRSIGYKLKTGLRRYLSETRDYCIPAKGYLLKMSQPMRQLLGRA